jgi:hypothetical protein
VAVYGIQFVIDMIELLSEYEAREEDRQRTASRRRRSARSESLGSRGSLDDMDAIRRLLDMPEARKAAKKVKRKASAYSKRYGANFKKCMSKHKKKNGQWKKGGYKRCVREAHRMSRK